MPRALALAALGCALLGCGARTGTLLVAGDHDAGVRRVDASAELCWAPLPLDIERNTMFVIDRSGSMEFDVVDDRSRWDLVSSTLSRALTGVPPSLAIGAKLFPQAVDECAGRVTLTCFVDEGLDLAIAPGNAPALAGILADHGPCGSTPLAPALEELAIRPGEAGQVLSGYDFDEWEPSEGRDSVYGRLHEHWGIYGNDDIATMRTTDAAWKALAKLPLRRVTLGTTHEDHRFADDVDVAVLKCYEVQLRPLIAAWEAYFDA